MRKIQEEIQSQLISNQDLGYRDFSAKLTPTIDKSKFIGVRVPLLRKLAKQYAKHPDINDFLESLPHEFVEENTFHGLVISEFKDYDLVVSELDKFLPYVDNWATCDIINPKIFKKNLDALAADCKR